MPTATITLPPSEESTPSLVARAAHTIAAYEGFRIRTDDAKALAKKLIKEAVEADPKNGEKAIRKMLVEKHGLRKQRVSELMLELGIRSRAASKKTDAADLSAELDDLIKQLVDLATTSAGDDDKAVSALRRAYLSAQGKKNAKVLKGLHPEA